MRPTLFYLFSKGDDIEIVELSQVEAGKLWQQGKHWLDMPKQTLREAQQLRLLLLSQKGQSASE